MARASGEDGTHGAGVGDRRSKENILNVGYILGVVTNLLLAIASGSIIALSAAILEKAAAAELLPRELRRLGFGILASANAVGDIISRLYVGFMLQAGRPMLAFAGAAIIGTVEVAWISFIFARYGAPDSMS